MNKIKAQKAQVLIITLWILIILSLMALHIGHRASMALRVSAYRQRRLDAAFLAHAGINKAIEKLSGDTTAEYDGRLDRWADDEDAFKKISLREGAEGFASVSYFLSANNRTETVYGLQDEERYLDLNYVPKPILTALFKSLSIPQGQELADAVLAWRGDTSVAEPDYRDTGYSNKAGGFRTVEELMLVKGITSDIYKALRPVVTVYSYGKINLNTASRAVLIAVGLAAQESNPDIKEGDAVALADKIIAFRENESGSFTSAEIATEALRQKLNLDDIVSDARTKILEYLVNTGVITAVSRAFRIEATGQSGKAIYKITAVIRRGDPAGLLHWHEN